MSASLKLTTWNVQGLGHVIKMKRILTYLKKQKSDIALLQETRLSDTEHLKLKRDWAGKIYFSSHSQNKKGTAILINKNLPFILEHEEKDSEGRFILITGSILEQHITILNIYAPNNDSPQFMSQMILMFNHHCNGLGFLAGDFNIPKTPTWRFNTSFLNSDSFCTFVRNNLSQFWLDNKSSPVSSATIWDH